MLWNCYAVGEGMSEPVKQANSGQFKKGQSGNPNGRPRQPEIQELRDALDKAKDKKGKSFLIHFIERAFMSDTVAIALAKKILPDLKELSGKDGTALALKIIRADKEE